MIDLNAEQLAQCTGARIDRATEHLPGLLDAMEKFSIDTPERQSAFLAQIGHESSGLKWLSEIWGPTPQQKRYERDYHHPWPDSSEQAKEPAYAPNRLAYGLGNAAPGDGRRFMGRGLMQITGYKNYWATLDQLREALPGMVVPDFLAHPEDLASPFWAAMSAANFWRAHNLNKWADAGDFDGLSDAINIGHKTEAEGDANGYAHRLALYTKAKEILA